MSDRGGMCRSPFGLRLVEGIPVSNRRLDKVDVIAAILQGNTPAEYGVFAEILIKSIHNYFYWGLGRNGCTDVKWLDAYEYLFKIRSDDQSTWGDRVQCYTEEVGEGDQVRRIKHEDILDDEDMRLRCFDVHYKLLNLDQKFPLSTFLRMLEQRRQAILKDNREQIENYLEMQRAREFAGMPAGSQMRFSFKFHDFIKTLSKPDSIRQVEELVMFPMPKVRMCRTPVARTGRRSWKRPESMPEGTLYERSLLAEANVGHTHNNLGRSSGGVPPL